MSGEEAAYRNALGAFATGVAIVTARCPAGKPIGLTVNSFTSISLQPRLVSWSQRRSSTSFEAFAPARHFPVHILAVGQLELCRRFAITGLSPAQRFDGVAFDSGLGGAPLLREAAATFECAFSQRIDLGDHCVHVGEVMRFNASNSKTLAICRGAYGEVRALEPSPN